ncbi:MAG: hypothetical protein A2X79_05305 [Desulfuromonadaceae bacterium GWB2_53_15]|nr:MAG: hypothetical protein A2X79_05305 [Desulfuromonadaceae bacterium GWB2_53_15]
MLKEKRLLTVQVTEKTLELMELLASGSKKLRIGELAAKLCLSRNEVLLLLVTLENRGMVCWDDGGKFYKPGQRFTDIARQFLGQCSAPLTEPSEPTAAAKTRSRSPGTRKPSCDRRSDKVGFVATAP